MPSTRNAPCRCGSGRKHKHCCLAAAAVRQAETRDHNAVGARMASWAAGVFADELARALEEWVGVRRRMYEHEAGLLETWFMSDRLLPDGHTPAEHAALRPGIGDGEREVARCIAAARLGLYRVRDYRTGQWVELEDVLAGGRVRAASDSVSRNVARWDVLLGRLMDSPSGPSLWGPCPVLSSPEEHEVLAELARRAVSPDPAAMLAALRRDAHAMLTFVPPSRGRQPSFRAFDGAPLVTGCAEWDVEDPAAAWARLSAHPQLEAIAEHRLEWVIPRAEVADRPPLPPESIVVEATLVERPDDVAAGAFALAGHRLAFETTSERRLELGCALVGELLGVAPVTRSAELMRPGEDGPPARPRPRERRDPALRGVEREMLDRHYRRWLDEPLQALAGLTPREAAGDPAQSGSLERIVRGIENRADRQGEQSAGGWLRDELGLAA